LTGRLLDAFYATMFTLRTLEVAPGPPPGPGAKVFTVSVILFGVVALFTAIGVGTEVVASGGFGRWLRMNQVTRNIGHLRKCSTCSTSAQTSGSRRCPSGPELSWTAWRSPGALGARGPDRRPGPGGDPQPHAD
jgi:hypothetical protein